MNPKSYTAVSKTLVVVFFVLRNQLAFELEVKV